MTIFISLFCMRQGFVVFTSSPYDKWQPRRSDLSPCKISSCPEIGLLCLNLAKIWHRKQKIFPLFLTKLHRHWTPRQWELREWYSNGIINISSFIGCTNLLCELSLCVLLLSEGLVSTPKPTKHGVLWLWVTLHIMLIFSDIFKKLTFLSRAKT